MGIAEQNQETMAPKAAKVSLKRTSAPQVETKPLVVTICHSMQGSFHSYEKEHLEKSNYSVWSSLEVKAKGAVSANSAAFQSDCSVVICIISKDFCCDVTCEWLVYFCQYQKKIVPVMYEDVEMPYLVGTGQFIGGHGQTFDEMLLKCLSTLAAGKRELKWLQQELYSQLTDGNCVYISGGSQFYSPNGQAICNHKSWLNENQLLTGGLFDIEDTVARSFYGKRKKLDFLSCCSCEGPS